MSSHPYRLGFAVKILGGGGLKTADARRWQTGPHLARSIELLHAAFDHLEQNGLRMFRLSSATVPYGTHPDLPQYDYRRQIEECEEELAALGARAREAGVRLSTHPGQYTVLNAADREVAAKARADLEQDALLLDALGAGDEAVVVIHVGGAYGDRGAALYRFSRSFELLSERARRRVVVEHDERLFSLADAIGLHERHGMRVVYDHHHHRCNPAPGLEEPAAAIAAAYATWPDGVRPKVHLSSPRTELRLVRRAPRDRGRVRAVPVPPTIEQHADFATPWDLAELLDAAPGPVDVMVEAKAKDLAVLWLRDQLERLRPDLAVAEERAAEPASATPTAR
jgi:UV DNA damage endonuclease